MTVFSRIATLLVSCLIGTQAFAFDTLARSAMIVDQTTGTVLLAKDADRPVPPASMSKLMTLNLLFEALRDGRVDMDTKFLVSPNATKRGGSTMFLRTGERVANLAMTPVSPSRKISQAPKAPLRNV